MLSALLSRRRRPAPEHTAAGPELTHELVLEAIAQFEPPATDGTERVSFVEPVALVLELLVPRPPDHFSDPERPGGVTLRGRAFFAPITPDTAVRFSDHVTSALLLFGQHADKVAIAEVRTTYRWSGSTRHQVAVRLEALR